MLVQSILLTFGLFILVIAFGFGTPLILIVPFISLFYKQKNISCKKASRLLSLSYLSYFAGFCFSILSISYIDADLLIFELTGVIFNLLVPLYLHIEWHSKTKHIHTWESYYNYIPTAKKKFFYFALISIYTFALFYLINYGINYIKLFLIPFILIYSIVICYITSQNWFKSMYIFYIYVIVSIIFCCTNIDSVNYIYPVESDHQKIVQLLKFVSLFKYYFILLTIINLFFSFPNFSTAIKKLFNRS